MPINPNEKMVLTVLLDDMRANKNTILALGLQYGAKHIRVFGSVARYEERPDSDIDILVEFPRGYDLLCIKSVNCCHSDVTRYCVDRGLLMKVFIIKVSLDSESGVYFVTESNVPGGTKFISKLPSKAGRTTKDRLGM